MSLTRDHAATPLSSQGAVLPRVHGAYIVCLMLRGDACDLTELVSIIERHATGPADSCALPRVRLIKVDHADGVAGELMFPVVCLVTQGVKHVQFAGRLETFEPATLVASAQDFPITGRIVRAPYRAVAIELGPESVVDLLDEDLTATDSESQPGFGSARATPQLVDAMTRFLRLLDDDRDRAVLGVAAERETLYRALQTPVGDVVRRFAREGHLVSKVDLCIRWIRAHPFERLDVEELSARTYTSTRTLHRHFRSATGLSPLQFQKQVRLQEARKMLLNGEVSVGDVGGHVGYTSSNQFNREYARMFGRPPGRDRRELG